MTRAPRAVRTLARQPPPPGIYASKYTPQLGALICARLAAGESLRAICRADPSMPTEKTVWNWRRAHPSFAARMERVILQGRARARERQATLALLKRTRRSKTGRMAWNRGRSCYSEALAWAICDRLLFGEPLYKVCRRPGMPSLGTVYGWLRTRPDFLLAYRRAKALAFSVVMDEAMEAAEDALDQHEVARMERRGLRRCAQLAPTTYADVTYGVYDPLDATR
jgi:hypothetical protein